MLTAWRPGTATENLAFFTYVQGFRYFNLGYACALAILQLIVVTLLAKALITSDEAVEPAGRKAAT